MRGSFFGWSGVSFGVALCLACGSRSTALAPVSGNPRPPPASAPLGPTLPSDLALAPAMFGEAFPAEHVAVYIGSRQLALGAIDHVIAYLPQPAVRATEGFGSANKNAPHHLTVLPLENALRRLPCAHDADTSAVLTSHTEAVTYELVTVTAETNQCVHGEFSFPDGGDAGD